MTDRKKARYQKKLKRSEKKKVQQARGWFQVLKKRKHNGRR